MGNVLTLVERVRAGARAEGGVSRSRRRYLDLVVDGRSLRDLFASALGGADACFDDVAVLVLDWPVGFPAQDYGQLLGERPAPLPDGRVPLYICPECGDLGCGAVTAAVERSTGTVVWRDFAYQTDAEPLDHDGVLQGVGPLVFDRRQYEDALAVFPQRWSAARAEG